MTQTTPREALDRFIDIPATRAPSKIWLNQDYIDAILTALAPWLRTPGTVEFCVRCQVDCKGRDFDQNEVVGNRWIDCPDSTCPIKQVTNEKA